MERALKVFHKFTDAEKAEWEYYASLSPEERLDMMLEIIAQTLEASGEATKGFERVCRIIELSQD